MRSLAMGLTCLHCGARGGLEPLFNGCSACAREGFLAGHTVTYDEEAAAAWARRMPDPGPGIWRYVPVLPVQAAEHRLSLGEGGTPLVELPRLAGRLSLRRLWVKDEGRNPTWSWKDRLAAVGVGMARALGAKTLAASSSGNHGAATAAYAAAADLPCVILTFPEAPAALQRQMQAYGARVIAVPREARWRLLRDRIRLRGWFPASSPAPIPVGNPYGVEGYKTIAYELAAQMGGRVPDTVVVPTGYGEGLSGIWKGYAELHRWGVLPGYPRMVAAEPAARAPLHRALTMGVPIATVEARPTVALSIGATTGSLRARLAVEESGGSAVTVDDASILEAQQVLASEGLFVEPSSAAALAALIAACRDPQSEIGPEVVIIATSSGLKDMEGASRWLGPVPVIEPTWEALERVLGPV